MSIAGDMDYAQARLSARFGEHPDEVAWRSIEMIRALPALLDAARRLPFRRWLGSITSDSEPHAIEAAFVAQWRAQVREVWRWMPEAWRAAIEWAGVLAELPVLEYLARGGTGLPWMREDPVYGPLCGEIAAPPGAGLLAPLAAGWDQPDGLFRAWRKEWMRRVPHSALAASAVIDACGGALASYRQAIGRASQADGAALRSALVVRLAWLFRRAMLDPASAFIFLALCALDLERLRGELLRRAIFPGFGLAE